MALAVATLATACAADDSTPGLEGPDDVDPALATTGAKADGLGSTATYYEVDRDQRRCAAPMCGGYFLSRVNRSWTKCEDGAWRNACYVAEIDFQGSLGMSDDEASEMATAIDAGRLLVRGRIKRAQIAGHAVARFLPSEVWRAQTKDVPLGTFYRVTSTNRLCVAFPCALYNEAKLNSTIDDDIHGLDFSRVTPNDLIANQAFAALDQGPIILAGDNIKVDAGLGATALGATQVYFRVVPQQLSAYEPGDGELSGLAFADNDATPPDYPRTYRFDDDTLTVEDAVSPCAAGATCVWSGIVTRTAHYTISGSTIELAFDADAPTQWSIPYVHQLAVKQDAAGQIVLVELRDDGLPSTRDFR